MKKLLKRTGLEGKQTVFLFTDTQIIHETFLEVSASHMKAASNSIFSNDCALSCVLYVMLLTQAAAVYLQPGCWLASSNASQHCSRNKMLVDTVRVVTCAGLPYGGAINCK